MRNLTMFCTCVLLSGAVWGQKATPVKKNPNKSGVGGTIVDLRKQPVDGVKAFVYAKDSIVSSGYCNEAGCFETGFTLPGTYDVKLVYPSDRVVMVTGVPIKKRSITPMYVKMALPDADTTIAFASLAAAPPVVKIQ